MKAIRRFLTTLVIVLTLVIIGSVVIRALGYQLRFGGAVTQLASGATDSLKKAVSEAAKALDQASSDVSGSSSQASSRQTDSSKPSQNGVSSASPAIPATKVTQDPEKTKERAQVSEPVAADSIDSVWGKTGVAGLAVYEYGKTLLSTDERKVYVLLDEGIRNVNKTVVIRSAISPAQAKKVYRYYMYDHSEVFYLNDLSVSYRSEADIYSYTFTFSYKYGGDKVKIKAMRVQMGDAALGLLKKVKDKPTDYDKEKALHDQLIKACSYDLAAADDPPSYPDSFSAYGALVKGKAVCQGYAQAMKLLLSSAGIKTIYITGEANGGSHAWNIVAIGGKWKYLDATFDDPVFTDRSGNYVSYNTISYTYFNFTSKSSHVPGVFNTADPFVELSENYAVMPKVSK